MPYIKQDRREKFEELIETFRQVDSDETLGLTCGDLNYIFTKILHIVIQQHGMTYTALNSLIGVLECCKLELYRRIASKYEDEAMERNGDVD